MATTISIATGALERARTYQNDAKAQAVLELCADRLGATGTAAQRLDAVLDDVVQYLVGCAREQHRTQANATATNEARELGLE
jgi:hypothetical protein